MRMILKINLLLNKNLKNILPFIKTVLTVSLIFWSEIAHKVSYNMTNRISPNNTGVYRIKVDMKSYRLL